MISSPRRLVLVLIAAWLALGAARTFAQPTPAGEVVCAWHVTIAPTWFDPSTAPPQITPFGILYALHDALVRPLPGQKMGNSLAESWTESADGRMYEFKLRRGLKFHNGDPVRRGREVQLRALPGGGGPGAAVARPAGRGPRSPHGALSS